MVQSHNKLKVFLEASMDAQRRCEIELLHSPGPLVEAISLAGSSMSELPLSDLSAHWEKGQFSYLALQDFDGEQNGEGARGRENLI